MSHDRFNQSDAGPPGGSSGAPAARSFSGRALGEDLNVQQLAEANALEAELTGAASGDWTNLASRARSAHKPRTADTLQAERVTQRVLAQTTREDLRRRGDVGVLLRFAGDRLRDSALLRVAAALLIVQVTLVPLVAWQMWKTPHSGIFQTGIEPSSEELAQALEDLPADELAGDLGQQVDPVGSRLDRESLEEGAAEAAAVLDRLPADLPQGLVPSTSGGRALAAMTRLAGRERCTDEDTEMAASLGLPDAPYESIVVAEARLYLLACGGGWDGLLDSLDHLSATSGLQGASQALAARTIRRAETMGVAVSSLGESLIDASGDRWQRGGRDWLIQLGEAVRTEVPDDPYVAAWLEAIVQDS